MDSINAKSLALVALTATALTSAPALAQERTEFSVCWSIYAGWMPWGYLAESGIMDEWADRYGISVEITQINDYVESINQYTAGEFDGCAMTNMDVVSIPAASGVDTTALIIGDYSMGSEGIILKDGDTLEDIEGRRVNLVELSVSHYFLARALDSVGLTERDVTVVNTADADIVSAFSTPDVTAVGTWNPMLSEILATGEGTLVADTSIIPGEVLDIMVVNTEVLEANPDFGRALVGAWFEVLDLMASDTPEGEAALESMATASGTDLEDFRDQLTGINLFSTPEAVIEFLDTPQLPVTTQFVSEFLFEKGLLGSGAPGPEFVGVQFPDGSTYGNADNVLFRYDTRFMEMAAQGAL